ncbi:hypothetical protein CXB51_001770 [Gossypium anomalum]|uniref:Uncharacterized protein n=1 Tax=Gossypium anomalum TaxID=47600 RepID=A0A8J5ZBD1_9ROSI|nr:hypothetical protein CXB51_001770 [Gossypium anomalum]
MRFPPFVLISFIAKNRVFTFFACDYIVEYKSLLFATVSVLFLLFLFLLCLQVHGGSTGEETGHFGARKQLSGVVRAEGAHERGVPLKDELGLD